MFKFDEGVLVGVSAWTPPHVVMPQLSLWSAPIKVSQYSVTLFFFNASAGSNRSL